MLGAAVIFGVTYAVWRYHNHKVYANPQTGQVMRMEEIDGIEAASRGEAHWVPNPETCHKPSTSDYRKPRIFKAKGGGYWCVYSKTRE